MLILVYAKKCDSEWYEFNFLNKPLLNYMFGILDTSKNIIYYYTVYDIETKFLKKGIPVSGIESKDNKVNNFIVNAYNGITISEDCICFYELYKIILGKNVSLRDMRFKYNDALVYNSSGMLCLVDFENDYLRNVLLKKKRTLFLNKDDTSYCIDRNVFLLNTIIYSSYDLDIYYSIENFNEFAKVNIVNNYTNMFVQSSFKELDISNLYCKDVLQMHRMFSFCTRLEYIKFCKLDLSYPISIAGMFYSCYSLNTVDFSLLKNDFPDFMKGINEKYKMDLLGMLNVYFEHKSICIVALPDTCPIFNAYFVLSNKLKFLGYISKDKSIKEQVDLYRSKLILKGISNTEDTYYVLVK